MVGGKVNVNRRKVSSLTTEEGLSSDESNVIEDPRPKYLTLSLFGPHQHQARPFLALTLNDLRHHPHLYSTSSTHARFSLTTLFDSNLHTLSIAVYLA